MGKLYSTAALCAILISAMPVTALAQANINTSRSNTKGTAPPAEDAAPSEGDGAEQQAGKKGYDYYQAKSDQAARAAGPDETDQPTEKANHNTARSNKSTVAAPAGEPGPAVDGGAAEHIGKKGYDHYQTKSDQSARATGPDGATVPSQGADAASTTVPKQTQGATFGERVNAGLQTSGTAAPQGTEAQAPAEVCKAPAEGNPAATTKPRQPRRAGDITIDKGKPDDCNGLVR